MIKGKNIIIRPLELGDEDHLHKWWSSGELMSHAGLSFGTLQSREAIRLSIMKEIESTNLFLESKRFIICKKKDMSPIGEINYSGWDKRNQKAEFGIKICEIHEQGMGYGIDSLYHFIDFMFNFLNLNKIELTTMIDNNRSQSLYKKLGFKEIGIIRDAYFDSRYGKYTDCVYMDILKSEWLNIKEPIVF